MHFATTGTSRANSTAHGLRWLRRGRVSIRPSLASAPGGGFYAAVRRGASETYGMARSTTSFHHSAIGAPKSAGGPTDR